MDRKVSSREYGVSIGGVELSQYELQILRSQANDILRSEHIDVSAAWVTAVLNLLVSRNVLPNVNNPKHGETAK